MNIKALLLRATLLLSKKSGAAQVILKHIVSNTPMSNEESLQNALLKGTGLIAIDTNVLLHYMQWNDEAQAVKAALLINGSEPVFLTDIVLGETFWTLTGKKYQLKNGDVFDLLNSLLGACRTRFSLPIIA